MKKQYILLAMLVISFTTLHPMAFLVKGKDNSSSVNTNPSIGQTIPQQPNGTVPTPQPTANPSPSTPEVMPDKESFDDIAWNPQRSFNTMVEAKVPKRDKSWAASFKSYTYPATIEKFKGLTLEKMVSEEKAEHRRQTTRAITEMLEEIDGIITSYEKKEKNEKNTLAFLSSLEPKMDQFTSFADKADELDLLDADLQLQGPAWITKYKAYIKQYKDDSNATAENFGKITTKLYNKIGYTNNVNRALYTLERLNPKVVKTKSTIIEPKVNDFLTTLVHTLNNSHDSTKSQDTVTKIQQVITVSQVKSITLGRAQLKDAQKALRTYKRATIARNLKKGIESLLRDTKETKKTEILVAAAYKATYQQTTPPTNEDNLSDNEYETCKSSAEWMKDIHHLLKIADEESEQKK